MRQAARVDANQAEIVEVLEQFGATVLHLHQVGGGCPDLAVGFRGETYLLELKDGSKAESRRRLTPDELAWHQAWEGHAAVVKSVDEALREIGAID